MGSWIKNLASFLGLVAVILMILSYFFPIGRGSTANAGITQAALDARLSMERDQVAQFVLAKTANAEAKLNDIQSSIQDFKGEMRENFKKLDDRLYELKQQKDAQSRGGKVGISAKRMVAAGGLLPHNLGK